MAKKTATNLELIAFAGEFNNFCQMFPYVAHHLGIDKVLPKNKLALDTLNGIQHKLLVDNVEFDENGPIMEVVEKKIVDIGGKPNEQPVHDWRFKSEECKEAFRKGEAELQATEVEILL